MLFARKKTSVIDRRIDELRKEMKRVRGAMKNATRPGAAPAPAPAPRISQSAGPVFTAKPPLGREENDLFANAARRSEAGGAGQPDGNDGGHPAPFDRQSADPSRFAEVGMRRKFANYFMAGHFQNLRPLRQESRIIRNKAIVMVIVALALIFWLVYYLQTH